MGLRSFLKKAVRALGLRNPSSRSAGSRKVDYAISLDRIEQQIDEAAISGDSIKLLDLWDELSIWKAPLPKTDELKQRLAQLFEEFEGQAVNLNAASSTIQVLRSQIGAKQRSERRQTEATRLARRRQLNDR